MDIQEIISAVDQGRFDEAESMWMDSADQTPSPEQVRHVLSSFVEAGRAQQAETMGWTLLEYMQDAEKQQSLAVAEAAFLSVPTSEELRSQAAALYRAVHGHRENFDAIWKAANLHGDEPPSRALRTLEICLQVRPGMYMGSRFDGSLLRVEGLNALGEFECRRGREDETFDPKLLADEFEILPDDDFRVLRREDPEVLAEMIQKDVAGTLLNMVRAMGGQLDSDQLKEKLVPKFIEKDKWSSWWSRARTAVKKNPQLTIEGKNPVTILFHEGGLGLEDEYEPIVEGARSPGELYEVLCNYINDAAKRKQSPDEEFTSRIVKKMADRVRQNMKRGSGHTLEAVLTLEKAIALGAAPPKEDIPSAQNVIAESKKPARIISLINDQTLWPPALEALKQRPDAAEGLEKLLYLAPAEQLDAIASDLVSLGGSEAVDRAVAAAMSDPVGNVDLCVWAWSGPSVQIDELPEGLNLLFKLLDALHDIEHKSTDDAETKKEKRKKIRSALSARDFERYRKVLEKIDEHMADVVKTRIERSDGLAMTVHDRMIELLKKDHYTIFVEKKVDPWLDESVIWTTEGAFFKYEEELRVLKEEAMPANAKQIGEAAEHGDLRENADWQAAIEERDMLIARARKMSSDLNIARILEADNVPVDSVGIGSKVTVKRLSDGETFDLRFLGPWDSDPDRKIYSYTTPLAQQLMGKKPGSVLDLKIENVEEQYEITALGSAM